MTHSESDVLNVKTLMLLQSSKPESTNDLRTMLIDAIINKYGNKRQTKPIPPLWQASKEPAKPKLEEAPVVKPKAESKISKKEKSPPKSPETVESSGSNSDDSESVLEILEGNINSCSVCRGEKFNSKSVIECSECHQAYHKECHNPPVTEDLSDPRVVWYCRQCNKNMNKPKTSSGSDSSSSKPSGSKSSSSARHSSSSSKTFGGSRSSQSKSGSSSINSSKSHVPSINIISADKRLQNMKKKAAKKQDKRSHNK